MLTDSNTLLAHRACVLYFESRFILMLTMSHVLLVHSPSVLCLDVHSI